MQASQNGMMLGNEVKKAQKEGEPQKKNNFQLTFKLIAGQPEYFDLFPIRQATCNIWLAT